jgi:peptide/nickel transport system permease protein
MKESFVVLMVIAGLVLSAPLLASHDPRTTNPDMTLQPPGIEHLLGTDYLGRDVWSRLLYGGQRTLLQAFFATLVAVVPGTILGLLTGLVSGATDDLLQGVLNTLLAFPALILALVILTLSGQSDLSLVLAVGLPQIAYQAQVVRSSTRNALSKEYVEAAQALGANRLHIVIYHVRRAVQPAALSYAGLIFGYSIINAAALSFLLGLSGNPAAPDWGSMLSQGRNSFRVAPWVAIAPGLMITLTVMSVNRLVDRINQ